MDLRSVRNLKAAIEERRQQIEILSSAQISISFVDGLPRAKAQGSRVEKIAAAIVDAEKEIAALVVELDKTAAALATEIFRLVEGIKRRRVLMLRYVGCLPFREIASEMAISEARVFVLHKEGVQQFNSER